MYRTSGSWGKSRLSSNRAPTAVSVRSRLMAQRAVAINERYRSCLSLSPPWRSGVDLFKIGSASRQRPFSARARPRSAEEELLAAGACPRSRVLDEASAIAQRQIQRSLGIGNRRTSIVGWGQYTVCLSSCGDPHMNWLRQSSFDVRFGVLPTTKVYNIHGWHRGARFVMEDKQMTQFGQFSRRNFMTTVAAAAGSTLLPRALMASPPQDPVVNTTQKAGKPISFEKIPWKALPFPMKQVRLGEGACKIAMEADRQYLHSLPPDRLLHTFRVNAGIASSAQPLGGWEAPDCELRGHYAGGHYLSACALMYASCGDEDLKKNADAVVAGLGNCQAALKSGYLSAFPIEFFDRLRERQRVWAPFYTIHKIMAGLLDMYVYCGNEQALEIVQKMAGWTAGYTGPLSYDHMQRVLTTEYGGMGEVLSNLYAVTGKDYYLEVAQRFDKKAFFDPLAAHRDELKGLHVNTHIPQVIAAARLYQLTGDRHYWNIADYFWNEVTTERSYCTGGTSNFETWGTEPGILSTQLSPQTTEDCCAYNMMKLTRHLFGWSPQARYMDYYERTLFNHRMGTIDPETGTTVYYLPLGQRLLQDLRQTVR